MVNLLILSQFAPMLKAGYAFDYSLLALVNVIDPGAEKEKLFPYIGPHYLFQIRFIKPFFIGFGKQPRRNFEGACIPVDIDNAFREFLYLEGGVMDADGSITAGIYFIKAGLCKDGRCEITDRANIYKLQMSMNFPLFTTSIKRTVYVNIEFPARVGILLTPDTSHIMNKELSRFDIIMGTGLNLMITF